MLRTVKQIKNESPRSRNPNTEIELCKSQPEKVIELHIKVKCQGN